MTFGAMLYTHGLRPGTLIPSAGYEKTDHYLKWGVRFLSTSLYTSFDTCFQGHRVDCDGTHTPNGFEYRSVLALPLGQKYAWK